MDGMQKRKEQLVFIYKNFDKSIWSMVKAGFVADECCSEYFGVLKGECTDNCDECIKNSLARLEVSP